MSLKCVCGNESEFHRAVVDWVSVDPKTEETKFLFCGDGDELRPECDWIFCGWCGERVELEEVDECST